MDPYVFIPWYEHPERRERPAHDVHLSTHFSGAMNLSFSCVEPVHVGTGLKRLENGRIVRSTATSGGRLIVPGSTLKGVIRSRYEAITKSCVVSAPAKPNRFSRVLSQSYPHIREAKLDGQEFRRDVLTACCDPKALCPACGLFGFQSRSMGRRGRVSFFDLTADGGVVPDLTEALEQFSPRLHHLGRFSIEREGAREFFLVRNLNGRKFAVNRPRAQIRGQLVEVIPRGAHLSGSIRFHNLTAAEVGGLLSAIGALPPSAVKVGAAKSQGFGFIRIDGAVVPRLHRLSTAAFEAQRCRNAFEQSPDFWRQGEEQLRAIQGGAS